MNLNRINLATLYLVDKATYKDYQEKTMADNTEQADRIREIIAKAAGKDQVTDDQKLDDLGIDSIDAVGIVLEAEEQFGVDVSLDEAAELVTVGDAVKLIEEAISRGKK